jgi:hypothetical protein
VADRALIAALIAATAWPPAAPAAPPLTDPTRPDLATAAAAAADGLPTADSGYALTSVLISDDRRLAVINDHVVGVGDSVDGARVLAIRPYAVTLAVAAERITVELPGIALDARGREEVP